jgi:hypothetical protein
MNDQERAVMQKALEALEAMKAEFRALDLPYGSKAYAAGNQAAHGLRAALAQQEQEQEQEQESVPLPYGLAKSDAEFWLSKRDAIIEACRAQGFNIVTTANGVHLMRLGRIKAEPTAWLTDREEMYFGKEDARRNCDVLIQPLYIRPPRREWRSLTNEEIYPLYNEPRSDAEMLEFARAIEAKLKEKNA